MTPFRPLSILAIACLLGGCATSVSQPTAVMALPNDEKTTLHLSDITADAADGVQMSDADFGLITQRVRSYIYAQSPNLLSAGDGALKMNIHFTKFDRGNALARGLLMGLGQIEIDANVTLSDSSGKTDAEYKVSKDFALGGIVGATTTVDNVEDGFAKSVAAVVK